MTKITRILMILTLTLSLATPLLARAEKGDRADALLRMERRAMLTETTSIRIQGALFCELNEGNANGCELKMRDTNSGNIYALKANSNQAFDLYKAGIRTAVVEGRLVESRTIAISNIFKGEDL